MPNTRFKKGGGDITRSEAVAMRDKRGKQKHMKLKMEEKCTYMYIDMHAHIHAQMNHATYSQTNANGTRFSTRMLTYLHLLTIFDYYRRVTRLASSQRWWAWWSACQRH